MPYYWPVSSVDQVLLGADPCREADRFWEHLSAPGQAPALLTESGPALSYADLTERVLTLAARLGTVRRLVVLRARNDVDTVVGYLACLVGQHPVLLVDADNPGADASAVADYDPDVVLGPDLDERREGTRHVLHPDLALLLSTSGSTGSPKLVRLSRQNVAANAAAIADSLRIRGTDVAATTLPLHYCYGLSVLASHLAAGAGVLLTSRSVIEEPFWDLVRTHAVTTFPGVPHTFDLLDRAGLARREVPSLRYLTCAGGRLAPATVERFAALGQRRGFDLVVMYGATEATARMAYLPPDLALRHPHTIGVAVPGGELRVDAPAGGIGELVYAGPNVMLGYAEMAADLARGREVAELRTGDLARVTPAGLVELTGRISRVAKVFGLRVDLGRVEDALLAAGVVGHAVDGGDRLVVGIDRTAAPVDAGRVRDVVTGLGVPAAALAVAELDGVPRLASGKPDHRAIAAASHESAPHPRRAAGGGSVAALYATLPGAAARGTDRGAVARDTFVSLGGDSLSYVSVSLRLERLLGHLPAGWHTMTVDALEARREPGPSRSRRAGPATAGGPGPRRPTGRTVETNVVLRAAAITMIVGSHANLFLLVGGAHLLVGLAGFNLGRFQLTDRSRRERVAGLSRTIARIAVPSMLWLTFAAATSAKYDGRNVLLLTGVLGTREWSEAWHYWFIEALVWTLLGLTALLAIPWVDRLERRWPFWLPMGLAGLALLTRYDVVRLFDGDYIHRAHVIFWLFALGWAAVKAPTGWHRMLVSAAVAATVPGFFPGDQAQREAIVVVGMLLLIWVPAVRVPAVLARVAGVLASASLFIYLCHWQIYPAYEFSMPWLATTLSLTAGIALWQVVARATPPVERALARSGRVTRARIGEIQDHRPWLSIRRWSRRDEHPAVARGGIG